MTRNVIITGATDGIGLATARMLASQGHRLVLHGRNPAKLETVSREIASLGADAVAGTHVADLSRPDDVRSLARAILQGHQGPQAAPDVLINNAGVFATDETRTADDLDIRIAVNTVAPYLLATLLAPRLGPAGRIVNLSSAAQAPVDPSGLAGEKHYRDDFAAYAQSKLALTMWNSALARSQGSAGPVLIAVNPGSLLGTRMVREGFGTTGNDIGIGADILSRAAVSKEFADATGHYFDNDLGRFADPHPDAMDLAKCDAVVRMIETVLRRILG